MRCFIHNEAEAIATCKRCGKAMCAQCSAYSNHSGVCPECRRDDFIDEVKHNENQIKEYKRDRIFNIVWAVLLCWTIIAIPYNLFMFFKNGKEIEKLEERNTKLNVEIERLTESLNDRGTKAFV